MREEGSSSSDSGDADDGGRLAVENARKTYAVDMARKLSSILQETSVAKFELDHLPAQRQASRRSFRTLQRVVLPLSI